MTNTNPNNAEAVAATGFLTGGTHSKLEATFLEEERLFNRYNELDDVISTLGTSLLGLTVGCARCHDHKYDAFSAREYYRLLSVFHSGDRETAASCPTAKRAVFSETSIPKFARPGSFDAAISTIARSR